MSPLIVASAMMAGEYMNAVVPSASARPQAGTDASKCLESSPPRGGRSRVRTVAGAPSARHREDGLCIREGLREDHLDLVALHLRVHGSGARVLAVLELRRAIGHDMVLERRCVQRLDDLG